MDVCCLSRLFDDQMQDKIRFETEAIISILNRCNDDWSLVGSDVIALEASKAPDATKRQKILLLHESADERIKSNEDIKARAAEFRNNNVKVFDSLHLATAEYSNVDIFLTSDAKFLKAASRTDVKVRVSNPLDFYMEVMSNG